MAGHVVERDVVNGQHVEPQKMLLTRGRSLHALGDARRPGDRPAARRAAAQQVRITTSIYPDRVWDGRVDHVGDVGGREDAHGQGPGRGAATTGGCSSRTCTSRGNLPDAVSSHDVRRRVPQEAIQTIGGESVVFVREGGRPVRRRDRSNWATASARDARSCAASTDRRDGRRRRGLQPQGGTPEIDAGRRVARAAGAVRSERGTCSCWNG